MMMTIDPSPRRSESESTALAAASRSCRDASRTRGTCMSRAHRRSRPRETYTFRVGDAPSMASRVLRRRFALNPKKLFPLTRRRTIAPLTSHHLSLFRP
jgi:hypothetical protein